MKHIQFLMQLLAVFLELIPKMIKSYKVRTAIYGVITAFMLTFLAFCTEADDEWSGTFYASTAVGLRFHETPFIDNDTRQPTAQFEIGARFYNGVSVQYLHRSEWFAGPPFNDNREYYVDEIQVKWTVDLWRF